MNIQMATSEIAPASSRLGRSPGKRPTNERRRSGGRVSKPARGGGPKRGGRGGRGGRGRGGKKEPAPTADELDKELDNYLKAR